MGIPRRSSGWGQRIEAESLCVDADVEEYYTERSACKFIAVEAMLVGYEDLHLVFVPFGGGSFHAFVANGVAVGRPRRLGFQSLCRRRSDRRLPGYSSAATGCGCPAPLRSLPYGHPPRLRPLSRDYDHQERLRVVWNGISHALAMESMKNDLTSY